MTQGITKLSISPFFLKMICQQQIFILENVLSNIRLKYFINLLEIICLEQRLKCFINWKLFVWNQECSILQICCFPGSVRAFQTSSRTTPGLCEEQLFLYLDIIFILVLKVN